MVKKNAHMEQRPEKRETASQIAAKKWIEEKRRIDVMYDSKVKPDDVENSDNTAEQVVTEESNKFEKRTEQFFNAVDKLFDELLGRTLTVLEALGVLTSDRWDPPMGGVKDDATRRLLKDLVRDIQDRIKDEYPKLKELK